RVGARVGRARLFRIDVPALGLDRARRDAVDANVQRRPFDRDRARKPDDARSCRNRMRDAVQPVTTTMLAMLPGCLRSRQRCAAACIMYQVPFRLVSMTAFQPFTEKSIAACGNCPPALLTRPSMRPCAVQTASNKALTASGSRISAR